MIVLANEVARYGKEQDDTAMARIAHKNNQPLDQKGKVLSVRKQTQRKMLEKERKRLQDEKAATSGL